MSINYLLALLLSTSTLSLYGCTDDAPQQDGDEKAEAQSVEMPVTSEVQELEEYGEASEINIGGNHDSSNNDGVPDVTEGEIESMDPTEGEPIRTNDIESAESAEKEEITE